MAPIILSQQSMQMLWIHLSMWDVLLFLYCMCKYKSIYLLQNDKIQANYEQFRVIAW